MLFVPRTRDDNLLTDALPFHLHSKSCKVNDTYLNGWYTTGTYWERVRGEY